MKKNIKELLSEWWFHKENIFDLSIDISLFHINIAFLVLDELIFELNIFPPWWGLDFPLISGDPISLCHGFWHINRNYAFETQFNFHTDLKTGVELYKTAHCYLATWFLEIRILGLSVYFCLSNMNFWDRTNHKFYGVKSPMLGIFWLIEQLDEILFDKTVYEHEVNKEDKAQYAFSYSAEWENKDIKEKGNFDDYPHGRIYYENGYYFVEMNIPKNREVIVFLRKIFNLPNNTIFKFGI
jgi:hypothetical protein